MPREIRPEVVFRTGSFFYYPITVSRNYFYLYRGRADAGCELTEEHSDAWEPHIANPEA